MQFYISPPSGESVQPSFDPDTPRPFFVARVRVCLPLSSPSFSPSPSSSSSQFSRSRPYQPGTRLVISLSLSLFHAFFLFRALHRHSFEALKVIFKLNLWEKIFNPNISSEIGKSLRKKKKDLLHAIGREIEDGYLR